MYAYKSLLIGCVQHSVGLGTLKPPLSDGRIVLNNSTRGFLKSQKQTLGTVQIRFQN